MDRDGVTLLPGISAWLKFYALHNRSPPDTTSTPEWLSSRAKQIS